MKRKRDRREYMFQYRLRQKRPAPIPFIRHDEPIVKSRIPLEQEREYWRARCFGNFWWFFKYAWGYDFNPRGAAGGRPWLFEETHKAACDWYEKHALQWLADRKANKGQSLKLMIVVPRDWGKTTLFTQAGQVWLHLHDPELATYTGAETITRGQEILSGIKSVISGADRYSRFAWLYGNWKSRDRQWKLDSAVSAARTNLARRDASFGVWGVEQGMVGLHPDGCFFDDPNTYEKMESHSDWLNLVNRHQDTLIPVFQPDAIWCLTATRYGIGDHIGRSIKMDGVKSMSGMDMDNVQVKEDGVWHLFFLDVLDKDDKLVMPHIWDKVRLESLLRRNPLRYWAQVRNNPAKSPTNVLTVEDCEKMFLHENEIDLKKLRLTIHLDTAFKSTSRKARGDDNAIAMVGHYTDGSGRIVFLGAKWSDSWDSEKFTTNLVEAVKEWKGKCQRLVCITDEREMGGKTGLWASHLHNAFKMAGIQPIPPVLMLYRGFTAKETRLNEAATHWRNGRMVLHKDALGVNLLIQQMTSINMGGQDDLAEAVADAFNEEVYTAMLDTKNSPEMPGRNPFDIALKPGRLSIEDSNRYADAIIKKEKEMEGHFDVVQP